MFQIRQHNILGKATAVVALLLLQQLMILLLLSLREAAAL